MVLECCCYFVVLKVVFGMSYAGERLSIVGSIYDRFEWVLSGTASGNSKGNIWQVLCG